MAKHLAERKVESKVALSAAESGKVLAELTAIWMAWVRAGLKVIEQVGKLEVTTESKLVRILAFQ